MSPDPDEPDDLHGDKDPFVSATEVWRSIGLLLKHGFPPEYVVQVREASNKVMIQRRALLIAQWRRRAAEEGSEAVSRELGLDYWADGDALAKNDPTKRK